MAIKQTEYLKFGENLYEIIPPLPSGTDRGGIIASPKSSTDTVEIKLGEDGKLYAPAYPDLTDVNETTSDLQTQIDEHTANTDVYITTAERTKLSGIEAGAQVNTIFGVKGDSESTYRTGNVNITKANIGLGNVDNTSDADKPVSTAQQTAIDACLDAAKTYTNTKTTDMATTTVVNNKISEHNTSTSAHNDIRVLISDLATEVGNFLDVDDTTRDQLSEVLELIDNNKGTLDSLTTSKVNVSDIIDNLETASANKVLSANQGVAIKILIDALQAEVNKKADKTALNDYYTKTQIDNYEFITVDDIDAICGTTIMMASEVVF